MWQTILKLAAENPVIKWLVVGIVGLFAIEFLAKEALSIGREIYTWNDVTMAAKEKARAEALAACVQQNPLRTAKENCKQYMPDAPPKAQPKKQLTVQEKSQRCFANLRANHDFDDKPDDELRAACKEVYGE